MAGSTALPLSKKSQQDFISYYKNIQQNIRVSREANRIRYSEIDKQYQREKDQEQEHMRARAANKAGDTSRFQNVTVPVVMPQVESAVTYQTSVFLTGSPIFGVISSNEFMDEAMQLETLLEDQALKGSWTKHLMMFFRDGFKYNLSAIDVDWQQEVTYDLTTDLQFSKTEAKPEQLIWSGNSLERIDPYNLILDSRVAPTELYKDGEFGGYTKLMSRTKLKQFINELPDKINANIPAAFKSQTTYSSTVDASHEGVYIPNIRDDINPEDYHGSETNWVHWAGLGQQGKEELEYKDIYEVTKLYCRVIPSNFGLKIPSANTPQIFKLYIVNHEHIIYCERQTNAHNYIPLFVSQPHEDGLTYQTKSLATNAQPFQEVASAYMNSVMHSRRRAVTDRVLYDPSRITEANINSDNPSAKIPVRPAAYGKNIGEAVYQFPYREDQGQYAIQQIQGLIGMANQLAGQNQASQGQFVKGNKTLHEFETVMQGATGRDQLVSILLEAQVFVPMKRVLKTNILQYQGGTTLYNRDKQRVVEVDPIKLRKAIMDFRISDGLTPASKVISGDALQTALQVIGSSPQIAGSYNVGQLFSYLMKTQGAAIGDFEKSPEQVAYEQALQAWQNTVLQAIQSGAPQDQLPPQPIPAQFNYAPAGQAPIPEEG